MNKQYPKGEGAMFSNQKQNDKQPDWRGHVEVTSPQLRELLAMAKANQANPVPDFKLRFTILSLHLSLYLSLLLHHSNLMKISLSNEV